LDIFTPPSKHPHGVIHSSSCLIDSKNLEIIAIN